ncbi:MAG: glutamine--tRNA ligase [Flavobacteriaceae bacterium]|nr:MAG: glutamine--tRNA ligase [Flavobacteriaceae bacterium]
MANFIEQIIDGDLAKGLDRKSLRFRFPPEPNGHLHIGHAKAICLNFGLGEKYQAPVNLRFDDTNPEKEEQAFVDAIKEDIKWLGFSWAEEKYASDYFQTLYNWAVEMIKNGAAYIDEQEQSIIIEQRKNPGEPGIESPYRNRPTDESLALFQKMKNGEVEEGAMVLRAKIDMNSPNMNMRDPVMYRVLKKPHHRTGDTWKIYPIYDWTHGQSDYLEKISHSLCTVEFENHRPLYEWYLNQVKPQEELGPKQREFARLNLSYTVTSKRKLQKLVEEGHVSGWDDPRMPTISGIRRRGYTPQSIREFCQRAGISKRDNLIDVSLLEFTLRDELNKTAQRVMCVVDPIKLIIENYPEDQTEFIQTENNPEDPASGTREIPFSREIYIEREDFMEEASGKFFRLTLGQEVRLKGAYIIKATRVEKNEKGEIITVFCSFDPLSKSGSGSLESKRKVKGTLHWVSVKQAVSCKVRIYDRLFTHPSPDADKEVDFLTHLNEDSFKETEGFAEPFLAQAKMGDSFQFQRLGYFCVDKDSQKDKLVFNKTVGLKDSWKKD